jgi:hypothetical protein
MWRSLGREDLGLLGAIDASLVRAQAQDPGLFPDFQSAPTVLIASDYSGSHSAAAHEAYSFLLLTPDAWAAWEPERSALRSATGFSRSMSFKKLTDRKRLKVLPYFFLAAGQLHGLLISLLVEKQVGTLFANRATISKDPSFAHWKPGPLEKLLRVTHFLGFLLAGITSPDQDVLWFTDEDEIAANKLKLGDLTRVLALASSHLLPHKLGRLRCGTAASDNGSLELEDLVAIPDLVSGALSELWSKAQLPTSELIVPPPETLSPKARLILDWFSDARLPLRRIVLSIATQVDSTGLRLRRIRFHGSAARAV